MADRVLGVLAGSDMSAGQLQVWADSADVLYAADSAADRLVALGLSPIVVGDLDSVDPASLTGLRTVRDLDPDRTDCDKMLALIEADGHTKATIAGLEGDLLDHVLASLSSLVRSSLDLRVVLRTGIGRIIRPGSPAIVPDCFGRRVSLVPLTRAAGVTLRGVLWEVEDAVMEPGGFLSVSNEGTGPVSASLRTGSALLFVAKTPEESPEW